ncbi:MAG: iron-containing redox enzyme family protein [Candidatus Rokubacteria bacterium]|nr:iron-containing redox enzyme family protein [Candidatus Rokubacteria bacterium]
MPLRPEEFAAQLLKEAHDTHPWLHHPLFHLIWDGRLSRDQVRDIVRQQGCFFLDTLRHAAWKIISVGGSTPTWDDLQRQRALIPLVVEEGGADTIGGTQTGHAILFVRLCEALGLTRDEVFSTDYLPTTIIEKNELFLLQRSGTIEALCGGNIATESINAIHVERMAHALERHYGVPKSALTFYHVHMEVEADHRDRAVRILEPLLVTDADQKRARSATRRAITARRICADGLMEAFVRGAGA